MTAVGKILVFLNLVFSLVVGAFVIMIYVARTHWVEEYKKLEAQNQVLTASARTYQNEATRAQQEAAELVGKKDKELQFVQQDLQTAQAESAQLRDDLSKEKMKGTQQNSLATKSVTEVDKRQEDVSKLRETLRKEQEVNNVLVKKNAELLDQKTVAEIEMRAMQDLAKRTEAELQRSKQEMVRMRSSGGSTTAARSRGKNPPTESVEGLVKNTDPASGLMTITIGSDAGLTNGHTLELFRINTATPTQSKYLGTIKILEADAHQSVAQPVGRLSAQPQPGDRVASRILGGGS